MMIGPGVAQYVALNRPDTKFDELGQYKADIVMSADDAAPYIKQLQVRAKAHLGKALPAAKNSVFENVLDDEGNATGEVLFKIRVKNRLNKEGKLWDRRPAAIDTKLKVLDADVAIWGGSVLKVKAEIYEWAFGGKKGLSLQPLTVQVIELKTGKGAGADISDFDEIDGGYEADESAHSDFAGDQASDETTDDNADY